MRFILVQTDTSGVALIEIFSMVYEDWVILRQALDQLHARQCAKVVLDISNVQPWSSDVPSAILAATRPFRENFLGKLCLVVSQHQGLILHQMQLDRIDIFRLFRTRDEAIASFGDNPPQLADAS